MPWERCRTRRYTHGGLMRPHVITGALQRVAPGTAARLRAQRYHFVPSLWWPEDRSWVLAREIDSDAIYLACSSHVATTAAATRALDARTVSPEDQIRVET